MIKKNSFLYNFCATLGWLLIVIGTFCIVFVTIIAKESYSSFMLTGGIIAVVVGVLVTMLAERNIFKALATALSNLLTPGG